MGARKQRNIGPGTLLEKIDWIPPAVRTALNGARVTTFAELRRGTRRKDPQVMKAIQDNARRKTVLAIMAQIDAVSDTKAPSEAESTL